NVGPGRSASATTPPDVATSLTLSPPYPAYVVAGQYVDVRARLLREDTGAPLANAPVELYGRRQNQPDVLIAHLRTSADGWVSSRRQPLAPTRYTVKFAGDPPLLPAATSRLALVHPQVGLALSRNPAPRGAPASLLVQVRPLRPGMNVRVSQFASSTMVLTRLVRTDASSNVRVVLRTDRAGSFNLRVDTGSNTDLEPRTVFGPVLRVQ
ncbi:MAG TPA: hypothetical protein VNA30_00520, partial [Mycobacteriales bacterium]|nr:hypothetical protein [Mycobacteriales bacterium]